MAFRFVGNDWCLDPEGQAQASVGVELDGEGKNHVSKRRTDLEARASLGKYFCSFHQVPTLLPLGYSCNTGQEKELRG